MQKKFVSVVIPAYNEGKHLIDELEVLKKVPEINEIIVVDDHSKDKYAEEYVKLDGIKLIRNEKNLGKGPTLQRGIENTTNDEILILDADLINLTPSSISKLIEYCRNHEIVPIVRGADSKLFKLLGSTYLTRGEHYIKKSVLEKHKDHLFDKTRWGFDNNINDLLIKNKCDYEFCELKNVNHIMKSKKYHPIRGLIGDLKMGLEVIVKKYKIYKFFSYRVRLRNKIKNRKVID